MSAGAVIGVVLILALGLVVVLLATGVIPIGGGGGSPPECTTKDDCDENQVCVEGKCKTKPGGEDKPGPEPPYDGEGDTVPPAPIDGDDDKGGQGGDAGGGGDKTPAGGGDGAKPVDLNVITQANTAHSVGVVGKGGGGDAAPSQCPQTTGVTKILGEAGWWTQNLKIKCGVDGKLNPSNMRGLGGGGPNAFNSPICNTGFTGVDVEYGDFVNRIQPICAGVPAGQFIGGEKTGPHKGKLECGSDEIMTGIYGKEGDAVDRIGIFCSKKAKPK